MAETFLTFKKFNDAKPAKGIARYLEANKIEFLLEDNQNFFDPTFANNTFDPNVSIKIKSEDFIKANEVLEEYYKLSLNDVDKDYYLFGFTDEELFEIISKQDDWGPFDYQLAKTILSDRGKNFKPAEVELLKEQRLNELKKPELSSKFWIYFGYFSSIFGGVLGLIIGSSFLYLKKTLPNGQRVPMYGENDRKHGKRMMVVSLIVLIVYLIWAFG